MAQVTYVSSSAIFRQTGTTVTLTGTLPASPTNGNMLVAWAYGVNTTSVTCATAGWSKLTTSASSSGIDGVFIAPVGSAAPVFTFGSGNYIKMGRIIEVSNAQTAAATFIDNTGGFVGGASGTTVSHVALTATGTERLGVCFILTNTNVALPVLTGMTGGTWVESGADSTSTANSAIDTAPLTSGVALSGGTATLSGSAIWQTRTIAIVPASAIMATNISQLAMLGVG